MAISPFGNTECSSRMTDQQLVIYSQSGDREAQEVLINRYRGLVRSKASSYFLMGADREDIMQEGYIGLFKAIRDYRSSRNVSFRCFADLCITRQLITAVKTANRQKHRPLNYYVSMNKPILDDESTLSFADVLQVSGRTPEDELIDKEAVAEILYVIEKSLCPYERKVLTCYLDGLTFNDIADTLGTHYKSVDNALFRVKRKLRRALEMNNSTLKELGT